MANAEFFDNPDFLAYVRLLHDLHAAIREGRDESEEGDRIRDQMDGPWYRLSSAEVDGVGGISCDFYWITDPLPVTVLPRTPEIDADLAEVWKAGTPKDFPRALDLLRRHAAHLEPAALAYLRGRIWAKAKEYAIASTFLQRAIELAPDNPHYRPLALYCLSHANAIRARHDADAVLAQPEDHTPDVIIIACQIRFGVVPDLPPDEARATLKDLALTSRDAMERMVASGHAKDPSSLYTAASIFLRFCAQWSGEVDAALRFFDQELARDPENPSILAARGAMRYGIEKPEAVEDLEHAIRLGTYLSEPYQLLSQYYISNRRFRDCIAMCHEGLERDPPANMQAEFYEWIGISNACLGAPREDIEAAFHTAMALAPDNQRIKESYEVYLHYRTLPTPLPLESPRKTVGIASEEVEKEQFEGRLQGLVSFGLAIASEEVEREQFERAVRFAA